MAMVVRSNLMAMNANRQLGMNNNAVSKSLEKLSSGFRINRAGDDASGLAISEKMKAQIKGLEQASANSQDGISLVQTAEGAMTEVHNMLNRMTELATKSANGTISDKVDRDAIQNEVNQLSAEIDRIGDSTNFNGINLLDGSMGSGVSAKPAADVAMGSYTDLLKDVAATKAQFSSDGTPDTTAGIGNYTYEFKYKDESGADKSLKIELSYAADDTTGTGAVTYKINGGESKTATAALVDSNGAALFGTNGASAASVNTVLVEAIKDSEMGNIFDVADTQDGNGDPFVAFTAKTAGNTKAEVYLTKNNFADGTTVVPGAATKTADTGTDLYHQVNFDPDGDGVGAAPKLYDGSKNTEQNIFTVNGKKFAFVAAGSDASTFAPDVTTVAIQGTQDATPATILDTTDIANMVAKINDTFGSGTAEVDATNTLAINFKPVAEKATIGGKGLTLQVGDTNDSFNKVTVSVDDVRSGGLGIKGLDVSTQDAAGAAIQTIRDAINKVSTNRGNLGALQNRLEYAINNLDVTAENMSAANSRIRDTDMAKEMMNYTKMNVLTQSAQAMLAQANQAPQSILQLLQ